MTYQNPLRSIRGLTPERVDQGVDYSGSGNIYALGAGVITNLYNSGWPGGTFISERLTEGPYAGQYVYYSEGIHPSVRMGQAVTSGSVIGQMNGGIEIGWAAAPGTGQSMAMQAGQAAASGDPGSISTAYGANFNNLLKSLGAPGGRIDSAISGTVPASFGQGVGNLLSAGSSGGSSILSSILSLLGIGSLKDLLERLGLILLGATLVIVGVLKATGKEKELATAATMVIPGVGEEAMAAKAAEGSRAAKAGESAMKAQQAKQVLDATKETESGQG